MFFVLKWMGVVALPLLAVWGIWRLVRQPDEKAVAPAVQARKSPTPSPSPSPPAASPSPSPPPASPSPSPAPKAAAQIQVLNGTATTGLGRRAADKLTAAGFQVVNVDNSARRYDNTTVFFKPGFEDVARQVAGELGGASVEASPDNLSRDVTAIVGADYQA
jgi:hypothetical protein